MNPKSLFSAVSIAAVAYVLPGRDAFACVSDSDAFIQPDSILVLIVHGTAFIVGIVFSVALTAIVWVVKLAFFRKAKSFPVFAVTSAILGIVLGLFATFFVPEFEKVFKSFGASLPAPTRWVLDFRYLLWLPLLLVIASWWPLRSNATRVRYDLAGLLGACRT
jgi:magnesium-transporting ATPase (P-type)